MEVEWVRSARSWGSATRRSIGWRISMGGMKFVGGQAAEELEENRRLKRAVADLTLDKQILKEASEFLGNG